MGIRSRVLQVTRCALGGKHARTSAGATPGSRGAATRLLTAREAAPRRASHAGPAPRVTTQPPALKSPREAGAGGWRPPRDTRFRCCPPCLGGGAGARGALGAESRASRAGSLGNRAGYRSLAAGSCCFDRQGKWERSERGALWPRRPGSHQLDAGGHAPCSCSRARWCGLPFRFKRGRRVRKFTPKNAWWSLPLHVPKVR